MTEPEAPQTPELEFSKNIRLSIRNNMPKKHEATPARKFSDWRSSTLPEVV